MFTASDLCTSSQGLLELDSMHRLCHGTDECFKDFMITHGSMTDLMIKLGSLVVYAPGIVDYEQMD